MLRKTEAKVFRDYSKHVSHMRSRITFNKFGLVLGAGVSRSLGIPDWHQLVTSISKDKEVNGEEVLLEKKKKNNSLAMMKVQLLFEHFRSKNYPVSVNKGISIETEKEIRLNWREILKKHLYEETESENSLNEISEDAKSKDDLKKHAYLKELLPLIRNTPVTVNYNFDDTIERILLATRTKEERQETVGYESSADLRMQFRRDKGVIFHPNGFIPKNPLETGAESFTFSDEDFGEQMSEVIAGKHVSLTHHFMRNTCLLIGLSLEDQTLRHILRSSSKLCPGHFHYYIHYVRADERISESKKSAIREANFNVYNLVTLFLIDSEIAALGKLLSLSNKSLKKIAKTAKKSCSYFYYITGAPGAGKTTVVSQLRSFVHHDEWFEPRIPELALPFKNLTNSQVRKVDKWLARQFRLKNEKFLKEKSGIHIIDRSPLDPISFTPEGKWREKAKYLKREVLKKNRKICEGKVLLLTDEGKRLSIRTKARYRKSQSNDLDILQKNLLDVFGDAAERFEVEGRGVADVVKMVARFIFFGKYDINNFPLNTRLKEIEHGSI